MKVRRLLTASAIGVCITTAVATSVVYAAASNQIVQGTTNKTIYKAADTVTITGIVNGDIFCAGQNVNINATVNGDVLCAGQNISVNGTVNGSVRLAGQSVALDATVQHGATLTGQSISVSGAARVGQDLTITGQSAVVNGPVGRDINGAADSVTLASSLGRNATLYTGRLTLESGTYILGSLTYTSPHKLQRNGHAYVQGVTTYHQGNVRHTNYEGVFWFELYGVVAMLAIGLVLVALFPQAFRRWNPKWGARFWRALLFGFIATFAVPVVVFMLMATVIGMPLAILVALLWIAAVPISLALAAYFTGSLIVPTRHPVVIILVGSIVLGVLWLIPILGWIVGLVAYWVGAGILLNGLWRQYPAPKYGAEK